MHDVSGGLFLFCFACCCFFFGCNATKHVEHSAHAAAAGIGHLDALQI